MRPDCSAMASSSDSSMQSSGSSPPPLPLPMSPPLSPPLLLLPAFFAVYSSTNLVRLTVLAAACAAPRADIVGVVDDCAGHGVHAEQRGEVYQTVRRTETVQTY